MLSDQIMRTFFLAVEQKYQTRVGDEFVIVGNDVIVRCDLPGFAADFLTVQAWLVVGTDGRIVTEAVASASSGSLTGTL